MTSRLIGDIFRLVTLSVIVSGIMTTVVSGEQVARSKGNGAYISAWGNDTSGCVWAWLYVSSGGTQAAPQTWMSYDVYNQCTGEWIAFGSGRIANAAFKVTNKGATLTITPSASPEFFTQGVAGSINLKLTADGVYASSYSGHSRSEYAGHVYQSHGSWSSRTATVAGTLLGFGAERMSANFGDGRDKYIEIVRSK